jgi:hypothetical protein
MIYRYLIDPATGAAVPHGTIPDPGSGRLIFLAFAPDGDLFAASLDDSRVLRFSFDSSGNAVLEQSIPVDHPVGVAISPAGELLVTTHGNGIGKITSFLRGADGNYALDWSIPSDVESDSLGGIAIEPATVGKTTPVITWANPADFTYGAALGTAQLDATASVSGAFTYTPPAGALLSAGASQTLTAIFSPADTTRYSGDIQTVSINVDQAAPQVSVNPVNLTYGTPLANSQLNGTATWTVGGSLVRVPGSFSYTNAAGIVLSADKGQYELVTFTPKDNTDYTSTRATVTVNVAQAGVEVSVNPVDLTYGTPLANSQLTGTATWTVDGDVVTVLGSFTYMSAAGAVPGAGDGQSESVTFTPDDSTDYSTVYTTVVLNVSPAQLTITADNETKTYGSALCL